MMLFFRRFLSSKLGAVFALAFLALIAFAFAAGDMAGMSGFGSGGNQRVAKVGGQGVDAAELRQAANSAVESLREENPQLSMNAFVMQGGLERVLESMIDRRAIAVFGAEHGIIASSRLIDSEIAKIGAFRGIDGKFSEDAFRQVLAQRGLSEKLVRADLEQGLIARQVMEPASFGAKVPRELATRYASLLREKRSGAIAVLPAMLFAPKDPPTDKELATFYEGHRNQFIRPERRVIRYAAFGDEALKNLPAPTDAEISAFYEANETRYAASQTRSLTQLIVPTEAAARAVIAEVANGRALEAAANDKGLSTAKLGPLDKEAMARDTAPAVAEAAFAATQGALAAPARSAIGWHVVRIDRIDQRPARSLEQVRGEIVTELGAVNRRKALGDLTARIEEQFEGGGNLAEVAEELGLTLQQTPALTSDGRSYENPSQEMPPVLSRFVAAAFAMEKPNEPQVAEAEPNSTFVIFDVSDIAPSAAAPLAEIKDDVREVYMLNKGSAAAKEAAEKLVAETGKGVSLAQAAAALKLPIPAVQPVEMNRAELTAQGQRPPPPLALMFSMAKGTTKILPAGGDRGWFVVSLRDIVTPPQPANDQIVPTAQRELGQLAGSEYAAGLRRAIRAAVKVEQNPAAIKALRDQLSGGN
jgi:peptidyl-prolyl cis-trans isomerase D